MGIPQSTSRFLGREIDDEEVESPIIYPDQRKINVDSSRFCKILSTFQHSLIYKAVKGLFRKCHLVISILPWPRKSTADGPILPIQNPITISKENSSLLDQPLLISEYSINTSDDILCHTVVDIESGDYSGRRKQRTGHDEVISIPDPTWASSSESEEVMCLSGLQEIAAQDVESRDREEDHKVMIKSIFEGIKHYNSRHRILVVGDGDFSFSACLALAFGWASNMISTSLDSEAFLMENYPNAPINIMELRSRKCKVMHEIDATKMAYHEFIGHVKFDRIIFNFPFAGFFKRLSRQSQLRRHRRLVSLFMKNAREMISEDGEIHITHKTNDFHLEWKLESIASSHGLRLIEAVKFNLVDYPGYNTKCGFGGDNNFNCNPSKTYKFGLKKVQYKPHEVACRRKGCGFIM